VAADNEIQLDRLARSFAAVGELIDAIQPDQWSAPTQCMDWTVHRLVEHLVGKNLVFAAVLAEQPPPQRGDGMPSDQLARAYRESAAALLDAFGQPGVLDRTYEGPLGAATGAERLKIRMYDLLAHGWDLAQALGRPADLPEDAVEESLAFARADGRAVRPGGGCFGPAPARRRGRPGDRQVGRVPRPRRAGSLSASGGLPTSSSNDAADAISGQSSD
jgi:uncharacterized protein (TIGR03086 family)